MSVKGGELIVGHIPRELSIRIWRFLWRGTGGERHVTSEIFRDSNGFGVSYRFVEMIMTVPHDPGLKQNFFFVHTRCSNPFPRFEFNKRRLRLVAALK